MPDFKNMPFGQLMMWIGGSFVAVIFLTIIVLKVVMGPAVPKTTVVRKQPEFTVVPKQVLTEEEAKALLDGHRVLEAHGGAVSDALNTLNTMIGEVHKEVSLSNQNLSALYQRVQLLEERMDRADKAREASRRAQMSLGFGRNISTGDNGYKTMATINERAWVAAGQREDSVAAGDHLPSPEGRRSPQRSVDLSNRRVEGIDAASGIIITSTP